MCPAPRRLYARARARGGLLIAALSRGVASRTARLVGARCALSRQLWEAFITDKAKASTDVDNATIAVACFTAALLDRERAKAVSAERPLSLIGATAVWAGWSNELELLCVPSLVLKAAVPIRDGGR
jgi:hypothetical protein